MNVDQLLLIVEDLSMLTTIEELEDRIAQCHTAYAQLGRRKEDGAGERRGRPKMLLAAMARMHNKIAAIKFSQRQEAQRAIQAAATLPQGRLSA